MTTNNVLVKEISFIKCDRCKNPAQFIVEDKTLCTYHYNHLNVDGRKKVIISERSLESLPLRSKIPSANSTGLKKWGDFGKPRKKVTPTIQTLCQRFEEAQELLLYWDDGETVEYSERGRQFVIKYWVDPDEGYIFTPSGTPVAKFFGDEIIKWYPTYRKSIIEEMRDICSKVFIE